MRAPTVRAHSPLAAEPRPTDPAPAAGDGREERSWLVFRLGSHRLCADTRAVEGIIEPPRITRLPSTPPFVLGVFPFRGQYALAVSLAQKLAVSAGHGPAAGPFVIARVDGKLAAFQVDEAQDVLQSEDARWQPLPEMLRDELFDRYTLRDDDLILHTSFAALLNARPGRDLSSVRQGLGVPEAKVAPEPLPAVQAPPPAPAIAQRETPVTSARHAMPASASPAPVAKPAFPVAPPRAREAVPQRFSAKPLPPPPPRPPRPARERALPSTGAPPPQASPDTTDFATPPPEAPAAREHSVARSSPPAPMPESPPPRPAAPRPERVAAATPQTVARTSQPVAPVAPAVTAVRAAEGRSDWTLPAWTALAVAALLAVVAWLWPHGESTRAPAPVASVAAPAPKAPAREADAVPAEAATPRTLATPVVEVKTDSFTLTVERPATAPAAAPPTAPPIPTAVPPRRVTYVVVRGDTLWAIARRFLGNPFRYPELAALSGIRNPDLIHPGDVVRIERK